MDTPENRTFVAEVIQDTLDKSTSDILAQIEIDGWEGYAKLLDKPNEDLIREIKTKGVCCLSGSNDSILMWGHYADGHKGMVIEYDTARYPFCDHLTPVTYSDGYCKFSIGQLTQKISECVEQIVTQKSSDWKYEEEFRMIHHRNNCRFAQKIDPRSIVGVYFGARCNEQQREIACRLTAHLKPRYFNAQINSNRYEVTFEEYSYLPSSIPP